jgi:hypothetical protein
LEKQSAQLSAPEVGGGGLFKSLLSANSSSKRCFSHAKPSRSGHVAKPLSKACNALRYLCAHWPLRLAGLSEVS